MNTALVKSSVTAGTGFFASVTDFEDSLGYCEYKIPLYIQGVKLKPSQSLILGTKAHYEEEIYEQEHVELEPVSIEQIEDKQENIEFARENIYSTLIIPFEFPSENVLVSLSGRILLPPVSLTPP